MKPHATTPITDNPLAGEWLDKASTCAAFAAALREMTAVASESLAVELRVTAFMLDRASREMMREAAKDMN